MLSKVQMHIYFLCREWECVWTAPWKLDRRCCNMFQMLLVIVDVPTCFPCFQFSLEYSIYKSAQKYIIWPLYSLWGQRWAAIITPWVGKRLQTTGLDEMVRHQHISCSCERLVGYYTKASLQLPGISEGVSTRRWMPVFSLPVWDQHFRGKKSRPSTPFSFACMSTASAVTSLASAYSMKGWSVCRAVRTGAEHNKTLDRVKRFLTRKRPVKHNLWANRRSELSKPVKFSLVVGYHPRNETAEQKAGQLPTPCSYWVHPPSNPRTLLWLLWSWQI